MGWLRRNMLHHVRYPFNLQLLDYHDVVLASFRNPRSTTATLSARRSTAEDGAARSSWSWP